MDFINGCTTNVHILDNFAATPFIHYTHNVPHRAPSQKIEDARLAIAELREAKVLCTLVGHDIWVFAQSETAPGEKYIVAQEGVVEGQADVVHFFLDAMESALSHTLAQDGQLTHVEPWTWLYRGSSADGEEEASLVVLHVKEAPNGALYLLPEIQPTSLISIDQASNRDVDEILLAPRGRHAALADQSTESPLSDEHWKPCVVQVLRAEGITVHEDAHWTEVEFTEAGAKYDFAWPSQLCLIRQFTQSPRLQDQTNWQTWTNHGKDRTYRDPLAIAEEWFIGSAERKRRAAEEASTEVAQADGHLTYNNATVEDVSITTSPPFMQRPFDHQAAISGIYPTPPDGLAHQGQTHIGAQLGTSAATPSVAHLIDAVANDTLEDAPEQTVDALEMDAYAMDEAEEDLFGDVSCGMFEENEVGDADFDYFDEPDDMPAVNHMIGGNLQTTDDLTLDAEVVPSTQRVPESSEAGNMDISEEQREVGVELVSSPPSAVVVSEDAFNHGAGRGALETWKRALSPFGIRERLLPPPVPASVSHGSEDRKSLRRNSSFAPVTFRDGVDLGAKYAGMDITCEQDVTLSKTGPNIALPPSRKEGDSEYDSDESASSDSYGVEAALPPKLPWESTRKRKRNQEAATTADHERAGQDELGVLVHDNGDNDQDRRLQATLLERVLHATSQLGSADKTKDLLLGRQRQSQEETEGRGWPRLKDLLELGKSDLICIAQLITEQASTCLSSFLSPTSKRDRNSLFPSILTTALKSILPAPFEPCDLSCLALTRDLTTPTRNNVRAPVPQRQVSEVPDIFPLPAPFIRIKRNNEDWEMLPPALSFWEPNGLAAACGPKNVKARVVLPTNNDLRITIRGFMGALGRTYEGCKLGTHSYEVYDDGASDAGVLVEECGEPGSRASLLRGYAKTCDMLGKELAAWCTGPGLEWEGTVVVYMLDPFTGSEGRKHLCACFWKLFQSYLERLRAASKSPGENTVPDVVLQILPVEIVACIDRLVIPDPAMLALLAREVYDRCPAFPAAEGQGEGAAAPSVLLAPPIPKRIAFQLLADVPADSLLQDGRVLHLAVAMSRDREWMSCVWSNGQGRTLMQESFCLRGEALGSVVRQVWQRTGELVGQARVVWRIFIVLDEGIWRRSGLERVWRDVVTSGRVGGTTVCVTLAKACPEISIRVNGETATLDGVAGLATPASTPAAFSTGTGATTGNNSPNIGASDGFGAPLTPAGSESTFNGAAAAMQVIDNDPDAHLVEVEDESCGVLFKPQLSALLGLDGMANGAIVRKGDAIGGERGLLGISLCWTLQVKPQGPGAVEIGSLRQTEVTLREVLRMYRALGVLTRARGLHESKGTLLPIHLAVACKGARGLEDTM